MAFLDKINSLAKGAGDLAKTAGSKTSDAIETGKLNMKIRGERNAIDAFYQKIGAFYYGKHAAGEPLEQDVLAICAQIDAATTRISQLEAEIVKPKGGSGETAGEETPGAAETYCPQCGAKLTGEEKFCSQCGTKTSE